MKTTSSNLFKGVMILTALLVPATTWWMSLRTYNARMNAERARALEKNEQRQSEEMRQKRPTFFKPLSSSSVEFAPVHAMRSTWSGQTDPDNVWNGQLQQANQTLMQHHLPVLNASYSPPPPRSIRVR